MQIKQKLNNQIRNQTIHYNLQMLRLEFFGEKLPNFIFLRVTLHSVGDRRVHGSFEIILTFEIYRDSHTTNQKEKTRSEGSQPKGGQTVDIQAYKHIKPNTSSNIQKLVF